MSRRVLHIINSLTHGGAEAMLCELARRHDPARWQPTVAMLIDDRSVAQPLIDAGIPIHSAGMRPGIPDPRAIARLVRQIRAIRPHVVQTWMDHSNLLGGIAARLSGRAPIVWGLHHSEHLPGVAKRSTRATVALCARFSRWLPAQVVSCSHHGAACYAASGFDPRKMRVIPNGFDSDRFRPDATAAASLRAELGIAGDTTLVALAARFDPFKDHATFVAAASRIAARLPDARFVLCGHGIDAGHAPLAAMLLAHGIADRFHLLGARRDVPRVLGGVDLVVSSSISEAFPLVLGEALLCGTPCVATDVGDSRQIIGEHGTVVPPRDPDALARAAIEVLTRPPESRAAASASARRSVVDRFDLTSVTRQYERLYDAVLRTSADAGPALNGRPSLTAGGERDVGHA